MKRVLMALLGLVVLVIALAVGALLLVNPERFRPQVQTTLSQALGRPVTLGQLHVAIFSGSLAVDDIRIGDDPGFGKEPFVSAKSLALGVRLWPLLVHQQLRITSLTLEQPTVRLQQNKAGRWNFASFGGGSAPAPKPDAAASTSTPDVSVDHLGIHDGRIELRRAAGDIHSYRSVQLSADHVGLAAAFPFTMSAALAGGGTLTLDGKLGPLHRDDVTRTPLDVHAVTKGLDLVAAGLMGPDAGVGGVLDIDTRIHADKGALDARGQIEAQKLKLVAAGTPVAQPISIGYHATYDLGSSRGRIDQTTLGSGKAQLALGGSFYNRPRITQLDLRLSGKALPVDDLQPLLPAFGVVLPRNSRLSGGHMGVDLAMRGPLDALVITGPVSLDDSRLVGYSLGSKLGGVLSLAGIAAPSDTVIKHAQASVMMDPSGLSADPFNATVAGLGEVTGKGSMANSGALDARMLVKLDAAITGAGQTGKGLGGLLGGSKAGRLLGGVIGGASSSGIGVRIGGTASAPQFKVDPSAAAGLLKAGLAPSSDGSAKDAATTTAPATKKPSSKDSLKDLLRDALQSGK